MRCGALTQYQCRWSGQRLTLRVHVTLADNLEDTLRFLQQHVANGLEFAGIVEMKSGCRQLSNTGSSEGDADHCHCRFAIAAATVGAICLSLLQAPSSTIMISPIVQHHVYLCCAPRKSELKCVFVFE